MHTDGKIGKHMYIAAEQTFTLIPKNQRQSYIYIYIFANIWNLLQARQTALTQEQFNHAKDFTSKIKKAVREDKEKQFKKQLGEMEGKFYKWNGFKRFRARPRLKYTQFVGKYGKRIPRGEYHNKPASYLAHEQCKSQPEKLPPRKLNPQCLTNGRFPINDSEFTMEEFNLAINRQGTYKTPGHR